LKLFVNNTDSRRAVGAFSKMCRIVSLLGEGGGEGFGNMIAYETDLLKGCSMTRRMESRNAIEVYVSDKNFVCIKEEDFHDGDKIIVLEPSQVPHLIEWLKEAVDEALDAFSEKSAPSEP
jgi:hypothetical protein